VALPAASGIDVLQVVDVGVGVGAKWDCCLRCTGTGTMSVGACAGRTSRWRPRVREHGEPRW